MLTALWTARTVRTAIPLIAVPRLKRGDWAVVPVTFQQYKSVSGRRLLRQWQSGFPRNRDNRYCQGASVKVSTKVAPRKPALTTQFNLCIVGGFLLWNKKFALISTRGEHV